MAEILTFLGFDVGTKRTGIAVANTLTYQARSIITVKHRKNGQINWRDIDQVIKEYYPDQCIIGLPLNNGKMQMMSYFAKSFGRKLQSRYQLVVLYIDEYLSSYEARRQLKWNYAHQGAKKTALDKQAAAIILQTWLNDRYGGLF